MFREPVTAVREFPLTSVTFPASTPPIVTLAVASKRWPLIVTLVPPIDGPLFGVMEDTIGPVEGGVGAVELPPHAVTSSNEVSAAPAAAQRMVVCLMRE